MTQKPRLPTLGFAKPHFYKRNGNWNYVFGQNHIVITDPEATPQELVRRAKENGIDLGPQNPRPTSWRTNDKSP